MKKPAGISRILTETNNEELNMRVMINSFGSVFLFVLLALFTLPGFGQNNDCALKLREAQDNFNLGQIEYVPDLLVDCIESGFTREERIQAFKLLINSYLFDDNLALAEQYTLEFLSKYPEYEIVATDPSEFVNLLSEFDNDPRSSIGLGGGINFSKIRTLEPFGVHSLNGLGEGLEGPGKYRSSGFGFQAGIQYNLYLNPTLEISLEPMIYQGTYEYEYRPFDFTFVEYSEDQIRVDFPVSILYTYKTQSKLDAFFRLGVKTSYLIIARSDSKRSYENTGTLAFADVTGAEEEITNTRNLNSVWVVFGAGLRYKLPRSYFFLDLRYNLGLLNQVNTSSRNNGVNQNAFLYYYLQDDFFMDDIAINIGIAKILYKPKRK